MQKAAKLTSKILLGTAAFLTLSLLLSSYYTNVVRGNSYLMTDKKLIDADSSTLDLLVLGDSHAKRAVNTAHIPNSFNFATPNEGYPRNYYKFKYILGRRQVKKIVLPVDLHSFSSFRSVAATNPHYWAQFIDYTEFAGYSGQHRVAVEQFLRGKLFAYLGAFENFVTYYNGADMLAPGNAGFYEVETVSVESKLYDGARARTDYHFKDREIFSGLQVTYFTKILDLARANGIEVTLVKFPVTQEYLATAARYVDLAAFDSRVAELTAGYEVEILDARDKFKNSSRFYDQDHLNLSGANEFTTLLASPN